MNITQSLTHIRGLMRQEHYTSTKNTFKIKNKLILWLQGQMTIKLYHKLQNTSTMPTQARILLYELSIISYIISSLLAPSHIVRVLVYVSFPFVRSDYVISTGVGFRVASGVVASP